MSHSATIRKSSIALVAAALAVGGLSAFTTPAHAATSTVHASTSQVARVITPLPASLRPIQPPSTSKTGRVQVILPAASRGIPLPVDPTLRVR